MFKILGMCPILTGLKIYMPTNKTTYRQPTNYKMLIFLFVEAREGPRELRGLYEREVAMAVGKLLEENSFEQ